MFEYIVSHRLQFTYGFVEQNATEKIVEDFSDLLMSHNVLFVCFYKLIFPVGQVSEHLVIKVHLAEVHGVLFFFGLHFCLYFIINLYFDNFQMDLLVL